MKKTFSPLVIIFIFICFLVPILSIESIFPWIIFLFFSSKCIKIFKNSNLILKNKLIKCTNYSLIAVLLGFTFNWIVIKGTSFVIKNLI